MFCAPEGRRRATPPLVRVFYGNALHCPLTVTVQAEVCGRLPCCQIWSNNFADRHGSLLGRYIVSTVSKISRLRLKCDGTRAETRFRLSAKRTSPFKSAGASVQSTTGSRGVRISGSNAGYIMFRGSVKGTGYPLHSPVFPSLPLPRVTVCHHISIGLYRRFVGQKCLQLHGQAVQEEFSALLWIWRQYWNVGNSLPPASA